MNSSFRAIVFLALLGLSVAGVSAQVISQPTPAPIVTADAEAWYLNGYPVTYAGNTYYPGGAQISFNSNEMVRSGFYLGVPLYTRTTDEPFSVVYVPLSRGFMRPYMRLRSGDVAGTVGTAPPSGAAAAYSPSDATGLLLQAAGSPTLVAGPPSDAMGQPRAPIPAVAPHAAVPQAAPAFASPQAIATSGSQSKVPTHTRIGPRPEGLNAIYVTFRDRRWYSEESVVWLDPARMSQIGDHYGFQVFADKDNPEQRIFVATTIGGSLVAAYADTRKEH